MTAARPEPEGDLLALGWDDRWADEWAGSTGADPALVPARLVRTDRGVVTVWRRIDEPERASTTSAAKDTVAGDWVGYDPEGGRVGLVLPRRTRFERRAARGARRGQVLAANIDVVWVTQALDPGVSVRRLERELVLAHQGGATPVVVLTKVDLVDVETAARAVEEVRRVAAGAEVVTVAALDGRGLDQLTATLDGTRTAALIGASGVGKSTVVNALVGHERQATAEVRTGDRKGRHTTTAAELVALPAGGLLIDTPGVRALALWDAEAGIAATFPEITEAAAECRFDDCSHRTEPGCAVLELVAAGRIDPERHQHWAALVDEVAAARPPEF